jgi:hypothetical protein
MRIVDGYVKFQNNAWWKCRINTTNNLLFIGGIRDDFYDRAFDFFIGDFGAMAVSISRFISSTAC